MRTGLVLPWEHPASRIHKNVIPSTPPVRHDYTYTRFFTGARVHAHMTSYTTASTVSRLSGSARTYGTSIRQIPRSRIHGRDLCARARRDTRTRLPFGGHLIIAALDDVVVGWPTTTIFLFFFLQNDRHSLWTRPETRGRCKPKVVR